MSTDPESTSGKSEQTPPRARDRRRESADLVVARGRAALAQADSATVVSGFGVMATIGALALTISTAGGGNSRSVAALGIGVFIVWVATSAPVAYAVAHVGVLPLVASGFSPFDFVLVEVGLLIMLFGTLRRSYAPVRTLLVSVFAVGSLVGIVIGLETIGWPLVARAAMLLVVAGIVSYLIHRYEYVYIVLTAPRGETDE